MKVEIRKITKKAFDIAILIKAFFGIFEILAGIVVAVSGRLVVSNLIIEFAQQEIAEDPKDFLANYLIATLNDFSAGMYVFAVVYLIFHGIVNIFLAIGLAKNKIWSYPWAITGFGVFIIYQLYKYLHTGSSLLLVLTLLDILIVSVIFLEYRNKKIKKK